MKQGICMLLILWLVLSTVTVSARSRYTWGDLDNSGKVDAADALMVLKYAVGKLVLPQEAYAAANVNGAGAIDAVDALLILQYSVGKIDRFPAESMTDEEQYYADRDRYYNVDGSDFEDNPLTDATNAGQVVEQLGQVSENSDIEGYELNEEYNLIYDRISREAKAQGTLNLYKTAAKTEGTLRLTDGSVFTYSVPTQVTAYSAVPLQYTLQGGSNAGRVHVEATTWEEPERIPRGMDTYYSNTLPDDVNIAVSYNGYVQAEGEDSSLDSYWDAVPKLDRQGTQYPSYTPSQLTCSGTLPTGKKTWLSFTVTNTGNTVLKGDGQGYFTIRPFLYQKDGNGIYQEVAINDNYCYRLYDPLYPGESIHLWVKFAGAYASYAEGDYQVLLSGEVANEQDYPDWAAMYVSGRRVTASTFSFTAQKDAAVTPPEEVSTRKAGATMRNSWLGVYEEFQSSFHTHAYIDTEKPERDTLYFQPAPWDTTLTLRVISDDTGAMELLTLPLQVESDSLSITLNPYNKHYVVTEQGTREPILATQNMADMRGNEHESPYPMEVIVNDLKDMQEAGINYLTSTMWFTYLLESGSPSTRVMMDLADLAGFAFEGYGYYPYSSSYQNASIARKFGRLPSATNNNLVNGILSNWVYTRYGRMLWSDADGITPIAQEDSRGWLTVDHDWRMDLNNSTVRAYQKWLQQAYGSIEKLNAAYGSSFNDFSDIDPRTEGMLDNGYYDFTKLSSATNVFHEQSKAIRDLDLFRTVNRVEDYRESLSVTTVSNAKMIARFESGPIITVGLKANTTNAHYRENYYQMQRAGLVGEVLAASDDVIYGAGTYQGTPFTAAETYELTKHATQNGLSIMNYLYVGVFDQIYNPFYGDSKAVTNLHLSNPDMKVTAIHTASALYPALKATYEAGGIPAVMWMDYYCNGFVTSTKYKELQFYTQKMQEMLATEEGRQWATEFDVAGSAANRNADHIYSYDPDYLAAAYASAPRWDKYNLNR